MLICFHHDWARNFPFAAMGLSDKYKVPPASISEFGFTYNSETVEMLGGEMWSGVREAEENFKGRAERSGLKPDELRQQMRQRYLDEMNQQRRLRNENAADEPELSRNETNLNIPRRFFPHAGQA
jgi:hypothetical protein